MEMRNGNRKRKLSEKRVGAKLLELASSRNLRKFLALSEFISEENDKNSNFEAYLKDEQKLYKEEVLFDFRILSENKNLKVQLC